MRKVILISFLCALFSCENDDMNTTQQILNDPGIRLNYVSNEFYNNNEAINNELKRFKLFKQNYIRNSIGNTDDLNLIMKSTDIPEYGITIEEDNVAHIQAGEYESFTFQIYNHYVTDELHNLCLSKRNDGSYNAYIYKYDLSQNQINQLDNGIMPSDLGSDASIISIEYLETTNMPLNIKSTFDPCEEYPCTVTHGGTIYWMFGANKCHSFESRLINGSWVITYPEVACPPEYTNGSDQNGGSSGGNTSGGTTQGGTQSAGGSTQGSGGTTQGGTQSGGTNTNPNGDNGWAGGGNVGSGSNNNNSTNSNDDENETYYCRQTEDGGEGECLSDITTPVACVENCLEDIQEQCDQVTDFLEQNPNFKTVLKSLDDNSNINYEKSCSKFEGIDTIIYEEGLPNAPEVRIPTGLTNKFQAFAHYHYETTSTPEGDTESVFTLNDLIEIARLASFDQLDDNFVTFLSTGKGTYYAFTIGDTQKFLNNMNALLNPTVPNTTDPNDVIAWNENRIKWNSIKDKFYRGEDSKIKASNSDNTEVLGAFLELLHEADLGLNMFKADQDFNSFSKVTFDPNSPNNIKEDVCN